MTLKGFHHLTAITADAQRNHHFYTQVLGLRLVKKTVNQDDVRAYHLFYADGKGNPGTDITFFDWPTRPEKRGTHSVCRTGLRIKGEGAFSWWTDHFNKHDVKFKAPTQRMGRMTMDFEDFEGQRLSLINDETNTEFSAWERSPVPPDRQIQGLGPITLSVPDIASTDAVLTKVMGMTLIENNDGLHVYKMDAQGAVSELHVRVEPLLPPAQQGAGAVHHVAFNIPFSTYQTWAERLKQFRIPNSGPVDRFWFKSLYFREPNGILFEIATDAPGFSADEPMETLGETLSLPPFLEGKRVAIEAGLKKL
jgi:glyoxalase family protein